MKGRPLIEVLEDEGRCNLDASDAILICEPNGATYIRHGLTYFICRTCGDKVGSFRRRVCPAG